MILNVVSIATYMVLPNSISRIVGYYHLNNNNTHPAQRMIDGPVLIDCNILHQVFASAAEA